MSDDSPLCKLCGSTNTKKYGFYKDVQRYYCHDCKRKFKGDDSLFHSKVPAKDISTALASYYKGESVNDIRSDLLQENNEYPSQSTIYRWVEKYSDLAVSYYSHFRPIVGDTWIADETVINIDGKDAWLWDIIDSDTRFLLATKLSYSRTMQDAVTLFNLAKNLAGKSPKVILTDKLGVYPDASEQAFGADTVHIQSSPFVKGGSNNTSKIERWHSTLKERTKVMRGLKDANSALAFIDGFLAYYNFMRKHESLNGKTPAEMADIHYDVKDWSDVSKLNEPITANRKVPERVAIASELETARRTLGGHQYRMGRKRKPRTKQATMPKERKITPTLSFYNTKGS